MNAKKIHITTSKILSAVEVPIYAPDGTPRTKILPVWQREPFIPLKEVEEIGLPKNTIRELIKKGELQAYYFNGVKKFDSSRRDVYVKLRDVRNLFK